MSCLRPIAIYRFILGVVLWSLMATSSHLWACACGCGVFEVGTSAMFPTHPGGMVDLEYDYLNQNRNWRGDSPSSAGNNPDKQLLTQFFTLGYQYMFNRQWGFDAQMPYWNRYFKTMEDDGRIAGFTHNAIGDVRLQGIYSGFSPNMSSGVTFGLKLPTGDYTYSHFDPDTEIGTGSTDLLIGAYSMAEIPKSNWDWFTTAQVDAPILHASGYIPGSEIDAVVGSYYDGLHIRSVKMAPLAQIIGSHRWSDAGTLVLTPGSGYSRVALAPGIEFDVARFRIYTDVGFPIYQHTTGDQLIASELFKLNISYHF